MKQIRKISVICVLAFSILLTGCRKSADIQTDKKNYTIMTTMFPYYDFVRAVVGDTEEIDVKLLVSPGQDNHSFEPTPRDIIAIDESDLLIYNGGSMEIWVDEVLDSLEKEDGTTIKMMDQIEKKRLIDSGEGENRFAREHKEEEEEEIDEHLWTSPVNSQILVKKICDVLCAKLPKHSDDFQKNAEKYMKDIEEIDRDFREVAEHSENREMIFADKFPLRYFAREYGLKYYAAFPGCSEDTEPDAKTVTFLIDKVKENRVRGIFYLELSSQMMADAICEDTGVKKYPFYSCHNITQEQFESGITYVELMKKNVSALRAALK